MRFAFLRYNFALGEFSFELGDETEINEAYPDEAPFEFDYAKEDRIAWMYFNYEPQTTIEEEMKTLTKEGALKIFEMFLYKKIEYQIAYHKGIIKNLEGSARQICDGIYNIIDEWNGYDKEPEWETCDD